MENVVLSIHLILALLLIGVVLLQRSEGGGLGMGSSSSSGVGGVMSGRQAANALTRLTWLLAAGFLVTSVTLTVLAAQKAKDESVLDRATTGQTAPAGDATAPAAPADQGSDTGTLGVVMPPAPSDSAASTGGTSGESTTDSSTGPITPPPAN
jgi:preprotein translocase subunit SecG